MDKDFLSLDSSYLYNNAELGNLNCRTWNGRTNSNTAHATYIYLFPSVHQSAHCLTHTKTHTQAAQWYWSRYKSSMRTEQQHHIQYAAMSVWVEETKGVFNHVRPRDTSEWLLMASNVAYQIYTHQQKHTWYRKQSINSKSSRGHTHNTHLHIQCPLSLSLAFSPSIKWF